MGQSALTKITHQFSNQLLFWIIFFIQTFLKIPSALLSPNGDVSRENQINHGQSFRTDQVRVQTPGGGHAQGENNSGHEFNKTFDSS